MFLRIYVWFQSWRIYLEHRVEQLRERVDADS